MQHLSKGSLRDQRPNVCFVFADQWRASAVGYAGDPNIMTPNIDSVHARSVSFSNAISNCPICTPYRASLLSGQYPLTTGLFMNDLCMKDNGNSLAQIYRRAGYDTAYVGKWHLDGHGRSSYIPPERRQGFDYWKVLECTHDYNRSHYYDGNDPQLKTWEGYDAFAQTADAIDYIRHRQSDPNPFVLIISYGTPHNPYETAPERYLEKFPKNRIQLLPNVPAACRDEAKAHLRGYYAHIAALDECIGRIDAALKEFDMEDNTIFVITSDHGDSVMSHCTPEYGLINKQRPFEESIRVPFLLRYPKVFGKESKTVSEVLGTPDIMPTLLELSGLEVPSCVEGMSFAGHLRNGDPIGREGVLIANYAPFADWRFEKGGREFRGIRTQQFTYAKTLSGPWMLFDHQQDPFQLNNLVSQPSFDELRNRLDGMLDSELHRLGDDFCSAGELAERYGIHSLDPKGHYVPLEKDDTWYDTAAVLSAQTRKRQEYAAQHTSRPWLIRKAKDRLPVAYIGMGILEWHGEHNAAGLDAVKADGMAVRFARQLGGVVVPPLFWGDYRKEICELVFDPKVHPGIPTDHTQAICEKLGYDKAKLKENADRNEAEGGWDLWIRLAVHIFFELESFGYRCIVPIPGHYPLFGPLDRAIVLYKEKGGSSDVFVIKDSLFAENGKSGDHAARFETSLMMAMYPEYVEMGRLHPDLDVPNIGVLGEDPRINASAEFGEIILTRLQELLEKHLRETGLLAPESLLRKY